MGDCYKGKRRGGPLRTPRRVSSVVLVGAVLVDSGLSTRFLSAGVRASYVVVMLRFGQVYDGRGEMAVEADIRGSRTRFDVLRLWQTLFLKRPTRDKETPGVCRDVGWRGPPLTRWLTGTSSDGIVVWCRLTRGRPATALRPPPGGEDGQDPVVGHLHEQGHVHDRARGRVVVLSRKRSRTAVRVRKRWKELQEATSAVVGRRATLPPSSSGGGGGPPRLEGVGSRSARWRCWRADRANPTRAVFVVVPFHVPPPL